MRFPNKKILNSEVIQLLLKLFLWYFCCLAVSLFIVEYYVVSNYHTIVTYTVYLTSYFFVYLFIEYCIRKPIRRTLFFFVRRRKLTPNQAKAIYCAVHIPFFIMSVERTFLELTAPR